MNMHIKVGVGLATMLSVVVVATPPALCETSLYECGIMPYLHATNECVDSNQLCDRLQWHYDHPVTTNKHSLEIARALLRECTNNAMIHVSNLGVVSARQLALAVLLYITS